MVNIVTSEALNITYNASTMQDRVLDLVSQLVVARPRLLKTAMVLMAYAIVMKFAITLVTVVKILKRSIALMVYVKV